jgi:hypothetical protein
MGTSGTGVAVGVGAEVAMGFGVGVDVSVLMPQDAMTKITTIARAVFKNDIFISPNLPVYDQKISASHVHFIDILMQYINNFLQIQWSLFVKRYCGPGWADLYIKAESSEFIGNRRPLDPEPNASQSHLYSLKTI